MGREIYAVSPGGFSLFYIARISSLLISSRVYGNESHSAYIPQRYYSSQYTGGTHMKEVKSKVTK